MFEQLKIALAQINLVVGDIEGNVKKTIHAARQARDRNRADVLVFPELTVTGYPPEDLLLRSDFVLASQLAMEELRNEIKGICCVIGHPLQCDGALYNAATAIENGEILATYFKQVLPNYSVFDEKRYFTPGDKPAVFSNSGWCLGITICEDVWEARPVELAKSAGAELILNLNASPFHLNKSVERENIVVAGVARRHQIPIVYTNLVGGQDELVFDGNSFVVDGQGRVVHRAVAFEEDISALDFQRTSNGIVTQNGIVVTPLDEEESMYSALVTGVRDYVDKNGFPGVVVGLSGGIDSALTLAIAADALGADRVMAIAMPSRYTREISVIDARAECELLGVSCHEVSIEPIFKSFLQQLEPVLSGFEPDTTEENIQARCRGTLLMAISNKTGKIVLTTGNKSEMAVGYATLYGDMAGGFAAIKDVPKTWVYRLARYRNRRSPVIPVRVLDRPPSAELAPDQVDQDSLPPYDVLDGIIQAYVEQDQSMEEIIAMGYDAEDVGRIVRLITRNEYKRRQAPPGVRISKRAFGRDRRYPLTSGYRHSSGPDS